jgi:hypothetical protein
MEVAMKYLMILSFLLVFALLVGCDKLSEPSAPTPGPATNHGFSDTQGLAKKTGLKYLGNFETLAAMGFVPHNLTYSPKKAHLFIISSPLPHSNQGIYEVTREGILLRHIPFDDLDSQLPAGEHYFGWSIGCATSGPKVGHFFLGEVHSNPTLIHEFDAHWNWVNSFSLTSPYNDSHPGEGIGFNHISKTLLIGQEPYPGILEVSTTGEFKRELKNLWGGNGICYAISNRTYFCTDFHGGTLGEFSTEGNLLRTWDLRPYGVKQPIGIAWGQDRLFIADMIDDYSSGGYIHVFKCP